MCGIAGILDRDGRPVEEEDVRRITRALVHRGPDGEGVYIDGSVGLGHRRLAILDLTDGGNQPMACVDGRYLVTFNGEIYNFVELRRELEAHGHRFRTESDTEVIGHAYDRWGPDCVLRFNGFWAFALWDVERRELFLSRDRFGIKPLFYLAEPDRFVFASELKAFLHLRDFIPREDEDVMKLALFKRSRFEMVEETLLQGVKRLQGGHNMLVGPGRTKAWRWWRTLDHVPTVPAKLEQQVEQFRELFFDSCRLRLRSDVSMATCLSGGIDSSSVLCTVMALRKEMNTDTVIAERLMYDSARAFVATFPGTSQDESEYARLVIEHCGAEPCYREMAPENVLENLREYTYDFENVGRSLMMPLWLIYRELRRDGVVVSLDGHGGDELFAGYPHYVLAALDRTRWLRSPLHKLELAKTLESMYRLVPPSTPRLLMRRTRGWLRNVRTRAGSPHDALSYEGSPPGRAFYVPYPDEEDELDIAGLGPLNAMLYHAVHYEHLPQILRNFERCSMAHGVESRMPFLDWRLVCFAFGVPEESKIGGGFTKRIVREAMRATLPEPVRLRQQKIGFGPPMLHWLQATELRDWLWGQVNGPEFLQSTVWNGPAIRDYFGARHHTNSWKQHEHERIWPFIQAHLWRTFFLEQPPPLAPAPDATQSVMPNV